MLATLVVLAVFVLSAATLTVYVAPLVTLATDFFVNVNAPAWFKALVHIALGLISAAVTDAIALKQGLRLDNAFLSSIIMTFVVSGLVYLLGTSKLKIKGTTVSTLIQQSKVTPSIGPSSLSEAVTAAKAA